VHCARAAPPAHESLPEPMPVFLVPEGRPSSWLAMRKPWEIVGHVSLVVEVAQTYIMHSVVAQ
jgi:hypothetical protein